MLAGITSPPSGDPSHAGIVEYSHDFGPHLAASFSYRNEGHFPSHHRDGQAVQLWAATGERNGFSLRAGLGAYRFFDTEIAERPEGFGNSHGWAGLASAALAWHAPESRWTWQLRIDRLVAHESFDTTQLTLGAGYRLHQDGTFRDNASPAAHASEVDVMAGRTIVNSFESESAGAGSIELRHAFAPALRASLGWISEGDARLIRRNGLLAQAWLEPSFGGDRFTLGVGLGPYFAFDAEDESGPRVHAVISTTASYHFADRWTGRITWHRIASNYNRDSDIVLAGLGYRF